MAKRNFSVDIDLQGNQLTNAVLDQTLANANAIGKVAYDTTTNRAVVHNGTSAKELAFKDDLIPLGALVGDHDASAGALPTVGSGASGAIDKGDYWRISVAGTITGLGNVEVGDLLFAKIAGASVAADFFAAQTNIDWSNAFENGISVVGGKAGLGGTLIRDTTITGAGKDLWLSGVANIRMHVTSSANIWNVNDEGFYLSAGGATQVNGQDVGIIGANKISMEAQTAGLFIVTPGSFTAPVGAALSLVNPTTGKVEYSTNAVAKLSSLTQDVAANTATAFAMAGLTAIRTVNVWDSAGNEITSNVTVSRSGGTVTVTANVAMANVVVDATGV